MKKINTGEFNRQITIQEYTIVINENGFEIEDWTDIITTFSKVENTNGSRFFGSDTDNISKTSKFTIRYREILNVRNDKKLRIFYQNNYYEVQYINNVDEANIYQEIVGEIING